MIIGVSGVAGSGKDTVADYLVNNYSFTKMALADPLKRVVKDIFDFTDEQLWGPSEMRNKPDIRYPREHGPWGVSQTCACCGIYKDMTEDELCYLTPRFALQIIGTQGFRTCYNDIWIEKCLRDAKILSNDGGKTKSYDKTCGLYNHLDLDTQFTIDTNTEQYKTNGVVIADCRFLNEHVKISDNGLLIRVIRDQAGLHDAASEHQSEKELASIPGSMFDFIIYNNDTIEELYSKVDNFYTSYIKGL